MIPPTDHGDDILARRLLAKLFHQLRHQRLVPGRLARNADDVDVVLYRLTRGFCGIVRNSVSDVDVEAQVGEGRRDHLQAAVVSVLAELHDEHPRPAPLPFCKLLDFSQHRIEAPRLLRRHCDTRRRPTRTSAL